MERFEIELHPDSIKILDNASGEYVATVTLHGTGNPGCLPSTLGPVLRDVIGALSRLADRYDALGNLFERLEALPPGTVMVRPTDDKILTVEELEAIVNGPEPAGDTLLVDATDCVRALRVRDLIEELQRCDQDAPVSLRRHALSDSEGHLYCSSVVEDDGRVQLGGVFAKRER
jgi:hypothetical protein